MEVQFYDNIEFETIALEVARDVVVYSFIAQRSLTYLDLSACENTLRLKTTFTEEQCRKLMEPRRQILYTLHLDLPRNLESSLREVISNADDNEQYETFHLGVIFVCECLYNRDLECFIIKPIISAKNKFEKLRRYLGVIKLLKLNKCKKNVLFLFENLIFVLYPYCIDSNLVVEFAITLRFYSWIYYREYPILIAYVLHHAMQIRCKILEVSEWGLDPINGCILFHKPGNISTLLEYGTNFRFQPQGYLEVFSELLESRLIRRLLRKNIPHRRFFLLLQLFYYVTFHYHSWLGLLYIWRSIPDPYLSRTEIRFLFGNVISSRRMYDMSECYKCYIIEETDETDVISPRSLQHLCRIAVRRSLNTNYQLPNGIYHLGIARVLQDYLNLRC